MDNTGDRRLEEMRRAIALELERSVGERTAELARANEELRKEIAVRKETEQELSASRARLAEAQRIAKLGSWEKDLVSGSLHWSEGVYRIFGLEPHDSWLTTETFFDRVHPEDRELVREHMEASIRTGQPYALDHRIILPDGSERIVREQAELIRDATGTPVRFTGTVQDITEQRRLEDQFRQAQKMEAIGRLAGGIAHDFNNLLSVILGYSELMQDFVEKGSPLQRHSDYIRDAAKRGAGLTRQLLAFSRRQMLESTVLDMNALVTELVKMLPRLIGEDIELKISLTPEVWSVKADAGQIEQVILNLAVNSRDAMPQGGRLMIETANVELDQDYCRHHPPAQAGEYVMVAVADTGVGMDKATRARLFEPFFTTKEKGKGTGLGLATTYGIVKQSGGYIWAYSEVGHGTTFKVYLPRVLAPVTTEIRRAPEPAVLGGSETILLVEDEQSLRNVIEDGLTRVGYRILPCQSAEDAIRQCECYPNDIHLLLTDVVMPQMSGREIATRVEKVRPGVKVLYMSGYTDDAIVQRGVLEPGVAFLEKPFRSVDLARKVREVLDSGGGSRVANSRPEERYPCPK